VGNHGANPREQGYRSPGAHHRSHLSPRNGNPPIDQLWQWLKAGLAHCNQLGLSEPLKLILGITAGADFVSLVTLCNNCPIQRYRHMGNNDSGIWETTLLVYGQQQHRDMTNNDSVIWTTTISAYDKQRQRDMTNNGAGICALRHTTVSAYDRMLVCALPHKTASTYGFMPLCA
jgi:hypothetical protein